MFKLIFTVIISCDYFSLLCQDKNLCSALIFHSASVLINIEKKPQNIFENDHKYTFSSSLLAKHYLFSLSLFV